MFGIFKSKEKKLYELLERTWIDEKDILPLLKKDLNLDYKDKDPLSVSTLRSKLIFNAARNPKYVLTPMLKAGYDINMRDNNGETILHNAIDLDVVQFLVEKGADINAKDNKGITPIMIERMEEEAKQWIKSHPDYVSPNLSSLSLFDTIDTNDIELVKLKLKEGVDINEQKGNTYPLKWACESIGMWGHVNSEDTLEIIKLLFEHGAKAKDGELLEGILSSIEEFKDRKEKNRVKILEECANLIKGNGVEFNILEIHNNIKYNNYEAVKSYIELGKPLNISEDDVQFKFYPLDIAVGEGYQDIVALLLKNGAEHSSEFKSNGCYVNEKKLFDKALKEYLKGDGVLKKLDKLSSEEKTKKARDNALKIMIEMREKMVKTGLKKTIVKYLKQTDSNNYIVFKPVKVVSGEDIYLAKAKTIKISQDREDGGFEIGNAKLGAFYLVTDKIRYESHRNTGIIVVKEKKDKLLGGEKDVETQYEIPFIGEEDFNLISKHLIELHDVNHSYIESLNFDDDQDIYSSSSQTESTESLDSETSSSNDVQDNKNSKHIGTYEFRFTSSAGKDTKLRYKIVAADTIRDGIRAVGPDGLEFYSINTTFSQTRADITDDLKANYGLTGGFEMKKI